jgi:hypothetical protein
MGFKIIVVNHLCKEDAEDTTNRAKYQNFFV